MGNEAIKVFLVENNKEDAEYIYELLDNSNKIKYDLTIAKSLKECEAKLGKKDFDIILLNLELPDSKGYNTFLKVNEQINSTPVIILTGQNNELIGKKVIKNGGQDYILKNDADTKLLEHSINSAIERFSTHKKLEEMSEKVEKLNNFKQSLIDILNHDLKNPAGSIFNLTKLLLNKKPDEEKYSLIHEGSKTILEIIENTRIINEIYFGQELHKEKLNLFDIINAILKEYQTILISKHIKVTSQITGNVYIYANPIIKQIFRNFISYAIKFGDKGKITIRSIIENNNIIIKIIDFGNAIPEEKYKEIFNYEFTSKTRKNRQGLGLFTSKKIAEALNINIWIEPNKPKGNKLCIKLQLAK